MTKLYVRINVLCSLTAILFLNTVLFGQDQILYGNESAIIPGAHLSSIDTTIVTQDPILLTSSFERESIATSMNAAHKSVNRMEGITENSDPKLQLGINLISLPFKTKYIFIESELRLAKKFSLTARLSYVRIHTKRTDPYNNSIIDDNRGVGIGVSVRNYFNRDNQAKGFFLGLGLEFMIGSWDNYFNGSPTHYDYGNYTAIAPHVDCGYKFLLGKQKRFYLDPMVALGFYVSSSKNERNNEQLADVGFFGFPGLTFGVKLF